MPTKLFEQIGELQFPRLSPTGFRIGAGASHASVITRFSLDKTFTGRVARPLSDSLIAFLVDIEDSPTAQTAALMLWNGTDALPSDSGVPHDVVACNDFDAADGHWGAWLETERRTGQHGRLVIDGHLVGYGYGGVRTTNGWVASPNFTPTQAFPNGRVEVFQVNGGSRYTVALHPEFNRWTCSTQGWVGFGYWGKPWIIAPNGAIIDVSHGWDWPESPPVLVHRPDGKVYAYTHTIDPVSEQSYVFGRWLQFPIVPKIPGQVISLGAAWLDARYVSGKTLLVGGTDTGYCAAWQINDTEAETGLPVTIVPPVPTNVPWVDDPKGTKYDVRDEWRATATAEQNHVCWFRKGDPVPNDPQGEVGAHLDYEPLSQWPVGLLDDSSTGERLANGQNNWMYFDEKRLWFPLIGESGWTASYTSLFRWRSGLRGHVPVVMAFWSGHAVIGGVACRYKHMYDPSQPANDPQRPKYRTGAREIDYYDANMKPLRWESWKFNDDGTLKLQLAVGIGTNIPFPWAVPPEAFVVAFRPSPFGAILPPVGVKPDPPLTPDPTKGIEMVFTNRDVLKNPTSWLPGSFAGSTIQLPDDKTIVTPNDGSLSLRALNGGEEGGGVLSFQPDGTWQVRSKGTNGPWESHTRNGSTVTYQTGDAVIVLGVA